MKKLIGLFLVAVLLVGCINQDDVNNLDNETEVAIDKIKLRTEEEAVKIAEAFSCKNPKSRSFTGAHNQIVKKVSVVKAMASRSLTSDTLLYALDYENGGFALIAAPLDMEPIVAIMEEGSYAEIINSGIYQNLIESFEDVWAKNRTSNLTNFDDSRVPLIPDPTIKYDTVHFHYFQTPVVKVAWNQEWPSNIFTTNGYAGCGPLAIAQLFSALEVPTSISYSFPEKDINSEKLDWAGINSHIKSENGFVNDCVECYATADNHKTIGRICREIGNRLNANYEVGTTGTDHKSFTSVIYNITRQRNDKTFYEIDSLYAYLYKTKGIGLSVSYLVDDSFAGHAWIIDAAGKVGYDVNEYVYNPLSKQYEYNRKIQEASKMLHHNWGWGGVCNGWINIKYIDPGKVTSYDYVGEKHNKQYDFDENNFRTYFYKI